MLKLFVAFLLLVVFLSFWLKAQVASSQEIEPIDPQQARVFGDQLLDDFVRDRRDVIYEKLEKGKFSRETFENLLNQLDQQIGKTTQYEFVSDTGKISVLSKKASRELLY